MVAARFEAERQALALMDHPHIARVLDGGITDAAMGARPYFVMEYVVGDPITKFADAHRLSIADRLALFTQVCEAVQHAHTKGIIHRDLKPGNVLVVDGQAKVLDFGLDIPREGLEGQQTVGTPGLVAPELYEGQPASAASDLYSLGMVAYRLFAMPMAQGRPAGLPPGFEESALGQVLRRLSDPDPRERYRGAEEALAALTEATGHQVVSETSATRESFLQAARFVGRDRELKQLEETR
jgi:serine/threonine protein kinase